MKKLITLSLITVVAGIVPIHTASAFDGHSRQALEKKHSHVSVAHKATKKLARKQTAKVHKRALKSAKRHLKHKTV